MGYHILAIVPFGVEANKVRGAASRTVVVALLIRPHVRLVYVLPQACFTEHDMHGGVPTPTPFREGLLPSGSRVRGIANLHGKVRSPHRVHALCACAPERGSKLSILHIGVWSG